MQVATPTDISLSEEDKTLIDDLMADIHKTEAALGRARLDYVAAESSLAQQRTELQLRLDMLLTVMGNQHNATGLHAYDADKGAFVSNPR